MKKDARICANKLLPVISLLFLMCLYTFPSGTSILMTILVYTVLSAVCIFNKTNYKKLSVKCTIAVYILTAAVILSGVIKFISAWEITTIVYNMSSKAGVSAKTIALLMALICAALGFLGTKTLISILVYDFHKNAESLLKNIRYYFKSNFSIKMLAKSIGVAAVCIIISSVIASILLYVAFKIPDEKVENNVKQSVGAFDEEGTSPNVYKWCISRLDNFTDSIMLLESAVPNDETAVNKAMMAYRGAIDDLDPCDSLVEHYKNATEFNSITTYARYWHGYLVALRPLLSIVNYSNIRTINLILQTLLSACIVFLMCKKKVKKLILPYITIYLMLMPLVIAKCLQFSTCIYIMNIGTIIVLLFNEVKNENIFSVLFLGVGIITAFLDLLTYPIITLGVPLLVNITLHNADSDNKYITILRYAAAWAIGYAGMWVSKWIIAYIITDVNVISDALGAVKLRSSSMSSSGEKFTMAGSIVTNFGTFMFTPFASIFLAYVAYYYLKIRKNGVKLLDSFEVFGPYLAVAAIPVLWYCILVNHSVIHCFFTNKTCAVAFLAVMLGLNEVAGNIHEKKKTDELN